jgi:drug/metabolite transporter (DMT)-like permease
MTKRLRADLSLAFCSLLWGATFVVVKNSLAYSSVFVFLSARFTLAALLMAVFRPRAFRTLKREELLAGAALGFFMFAGYAFQTAGLRYTTPAKSGFVTGSSVVLVPLLLGVFWGRRLTFWVYAGVSAAVFGLYFLTVPSEGLAHHNRGDLLTLVAAGFYAVHIILVGETTLGGTPLPPSASSRLRRARLWRGLRPGWLQRRSGSRSASGGKHNRSLGLPSPRYWRPQ